MRDLGISEPLVCTIEWMYKQTAFRVNAKNIHIGCGVIQGGVLSPTLFLIMFNDILQKLEESNLEPYAYADDLAIVGQTKDKLKQAQDIVETWANLQDLVLL